MSGQLHIYTPTITGRISYTLNYLLGSFTELSVVVTSDLEVYQSAPGLKINYSFTRICTGELQVLPHGLLTETGIQPQSLEPLTYDGIPVFFGHDEPATDFPFDILAFVFFLASRYEEYLPFTPDDHQRFSAVQSLAYKYGFLDKPVVNILLRHLLEKLYHKNGLTYQPVGAYRFLPTYDIDMVWSYLHKGFLRTAGSLARDFLKGDLKTITGKIKAHLGLAGDPAFSFDHIEALHRQYGVEAITFFLLGDHSRFDKNQSPDHPSLRQFIAKRFRNRQIGIHPSYYADYQLTLKEKKRLEDISGTTVFRSRQHYLRLSFPETYRNLIQAGITEDYSMGYADKTGFRAGLATPFRWYDLPLEEITSLTIVPFCVMDVTLNQYLGLSPMQAIEKISSLITEVKAVNGCFCSLWHNTSFDEKSAAWKGWKEVYAYLLGEAFHS